MTIRVLSEHPGLIVVDKPVGVPVVPGRDGGISVRAQLEAQLGKPVWVVHRLDRDTSGALAFALDAATHRALNGAFEHHQVGKRYLALVKGRLERPQRVDTALVKIRSGKVRVVKPGEAGLAAVTELRPLEVFDDATLVEAEPLTGRSHQIRVHLLSLGHPLVVDHQYGQVAPFHALTRTPLHAWRLELPLGSGRVTVEAPLPADLEAALAALRDRTR